MVVYYSFNILINTYFRNLDGRFYYKYSFTVYLSWLCMIWMISFIQSFLIFWYCMSIFIIFYTYILSNEIISIIFILIVFLSLYFIVACIFERKMFFYSANLLMNLLMNGLWFFLIFLSLYFLNLKFILMILTFEVILSFQCISIYQVFENM